MKTFSELTDAAKLAAQTNVSRADFLASLSPEERSNAALQFDRMQRYLSTHIPTAEELAADRLHQELKRKNISNMEAFLACHGHSPLIEFLLYCAIVTTTPLVENNDERSYIASRLGLGQ